MSKTDKHLNTFIVCGLLSMAMATHAHAQSANDTATPVFSDSLQTSNSNLRSINNLSSADAQRNQLLGEPEALPQPAPQIPVVRNIQQRAQPVTPAAPITNPTDPDGSTLGNIAVSPVQTGTPATIEQDPFAPTGIRLGTFDLNVSLEQAIGYSDNVSNQAGGNGGAFSETTANATITSNWARHQWQTNLNGSYLRPFDGDEVDQPRLNIDSQLRLDLIDGYTLTTRGFYALSTQGFTSSTLVPGAVDNPLQANYGASVELQRTDRKLQLTVRGDIQRDEFEDTDLGGGLIQSEADQNNNEYRLTTRVGYEISPALTPFVEASYAMRDFDQQTDRNGNQRDSDIFELRGGVEMDLGEKLAGELAIGLVNEAFDDPALEDLNAFTINGQLNWSPQRDTQVALTLGTQTNNSITANESGSIIYNGRLGVDKQITDRLSVNAFADAQVETNDDENTTLQVGIGAQYWVNRFMAITSQVDYQRFQTNAPNSSFNATSAQVGVLLQR